MLENFETYRGVLDTYCEENDCVDDMDLMADAFETIEEMNDEEIDIALAIYRVANRLTDAAVDKVGTQTDGAASKVAKKKIRHKIVQAIREEVDLPVEIVETIISEFDGDFESFGEQLKTAKEAVKVGHGVGSGPLSRPRTGGVTPPPRTGGVNPSFEAVNGVLDGTI